MPRFIPDDILDQIRMRSDIVDIIQSYVPTLKRAGTAWKACCPFHQEKTPSFTVNPARQSYKCFGCGKGGNVFTFIMEMEKLDFPNAAEFLARKAGVVIPEDETSGRGIAFRGKGDAGDYNLRERLYTLHELLATWYAKNLSTGAVPTVCQYFSTRGIATEFMNRFQIGAAPDSWDAAVNLAHKNGYTDEELRLSGIVSEKEERSGHIYDRFRNRLMFPIWNEQGRVVAFSARSVEKDPKGWKYVNSPETPVFKKSRTLYALHFARTAIAEKKFAVLCEGQLDVIAMHRAGCSMAVAAQGTAFGVEHAAILKRYTGEVRLALDNDAAGRKAVFADAEILLPLGFNVKVVTWQNAKDADEVLKDQGAETVQRAVAEAVDFFEFALADASANADLASPAGKAVAADKVLERIRLLESSVTRETYVSWLAEKLNLPADALRMDLQKKVDSDQRQRSYRDRRDAERENLRREQNVAENKEDTAEKTIPFSKRSEAVEGAFYQLLSLLLEDEKLARAAAHDIEESMCEGSLIGTAVDLAIQATLSGKWQDAAPVIMMELSKTGEDLAGISALITGTGSDVSENDGDQADVSAGTAADDNAEMSLEARLAEFGFIDDDEADEGSGPVSDEELHRKKIYDDCIRVLQTEQCHVRMAELRADAANMDDDDPEKRSILKQIAELSARSIRNLKKDDGRKKDAEFSSAPLDLSTDL